MKYFNRFFVWLTLILMAGMLGIITYIFIPKALPLIHVPITVSRQEVLSKAQELASTHRWGLEHYHQAVAFQTDDFTKTFVELEGGGQAAFLAMMEKKLYMPYYWSVRHFKEFETHETEIRFLPTGQPYGFRATLAEDQNGAALDSIAAKTIAEHAMNDWHINVTEFLLVETSQETKPSNRIDHTFVYERPEQIGQGRYRLRMVVSGDHVTEITHFLKVPEPFTIRYKEMRSANESIAHAARLVMQLLFIIGGCIIGLLFLFKQRWVIWRSPAYWAFFIALLAFFDALNQLPLFWMQYDTALSFHGYLLRFFMQEVFDFITQFCFLLLIFMAGESLTRRAFKNHIQFWKSWTINAASSVQILGRTIGGYLLVSLDFAFIIFFYILTRTFLGWWVPSESLANPNILATYVPWLHSLAISLQAGFMEECLFRAVPLAAGALIGRKLGRERLCIAIAFILQVLIFGAAHAWYPVQPAYARIVELIFTSSLFGYIYLIFGLLPVIIAHFIYDAIWTSLPLFVSTAPYAWVNQVIILVLALVPLWVVLYARYCYGKWHQLDSRFYNKAWQPEPEIIKSHSTVKRIVHTLNPIVHYGAFVTLVLGLLFWILTIPFVQQAPPLNTQRAEAITQAHQIFSKNSIDDRYPLSYLFSNFDQITDEKLQHQFIWQQVGPEIYKKLLGTYLSVPRWTTRLVRFTGTPSERADAYYAFIKGNNEVYRIAHQLPEDEPGAQLSQDQARIIAHRALQEKFTIDPTTVEEISAIANKLPQRLDWVFIFRDPAHNLNKGQARIMVEIDGDIVTDYRRLIHVPETWEREHRSLENIITMLMFMCTMLIYGLFIIGSSTMLFRLTMPLLKQALLLCIPFALLFVLNAINAWPRVIAEFNTSEPFYAQLFRAYGSEAMRILIKTTIFTLSLLYIIHQTGRYYITARFRVGLMGISFGCLVAGLLAFINFFMPSTEPLWAMYTPLAYLVPVWATITYAILYFVIFTLLILIFMTLLNKITYHGNRYQIPAFFLCVIFGLVLYSLQSLDNIPLWLTAGSCLGIMLFCAYILIGRFSYGFVPLAVAAFWILQLVQQAVFAAYPGAMIYNILAITIISALSWCWYIYLDHLRI